jgi:hypothetical protein
MADETKGKTGAAKKAPAKKAAPKKTPAKAPAKRAAAAKPAGDLRSEVRDFASARPEGWDHNDWLTFLDHLSSRGHDTTDQEQIGRMLERERLGIVLSQVRGLGPKRVDALVDRFDTLWSARRADVDDIAAVTGMTRPLAEKVRQALA